MNKDKLIFSLKMLKKHINYALGLSDDKHEITGYELLPVLLESASCNTYIETISNKADIFYLRCKESLISMMEHAYLNHIKGVSNKVKLPTAASCRDFFSIKICFEIILSIIYLNLSY